MYVFTNIIKSQHISLHIEKCEFKNIKKVTPFEVALNIVIDIFVLYFKSF